MTRTLVPVRVGDSLLKLLGLCLLAGVLVAGMLFPVVGALGVMSNRASDTIDSVSADLVATDPPLVTRVTDAQGKTIATIYDQYRLPVTPDQISPTMTAALVAIEDRRFYDHHGVDWKGTIRAAISNQTGGDVQGASTLTQQYVKNYLINVVNRNNKTEQNKAQEQTIARKLREARIAIQLEQKMSKEEILTGYLNVVEFAYEVYGIGAASNAYFGTTPDKLTVAQSALLAGAVNNPVLYNPWRNPAGTLARRNLVLDKMVETQKLSPEAAEEAKKEPLGILPEVRKPPANCVGAGPEIGFFCQYVWVYLQEIGFTPDQITTGGYTIKTTLDRRATDLAKAAAEAQVPKSIEGVANTMAIVRPGKERHEVVALVSNRDYGLNGDKGQTTIPYPYGVENKFGAGSVFKTFTAAAYLEAGGGINNVIKTPNRYQSSKFLGGGERCGAAPYPNTRYYCLGNYNDKYPPQMTLQQALATSPNTGFVILEERVGMDAVVEMANRLGLRKTLASNILGRTPDPNAENKDLRISQSQFFKPSEHNKHGNASFTLSPAPVSTLELANVAATIISGGVWCPPTPLIEVRDRNGKKLDYTEQPCEQVVDEKLANSLAIGMSHDDEGSGTAAGAARAFGWDRHSIGKTGTTQAFKSAAFIGATPQLAGAVATFNDSPRPEGICLNPVRLCGENGRITGGSVPARTFYQSMSKILQGKPNLPLPPATERYLEGGPEVKVPNVIGKSREEATDILTRAGYKVVAQDLNSERKRGTVVGQSPRGAALPGETITIQVSTGYVPPPRTTDPTDAPPSGPNPPPGDRPPGDRPPGGPGDNPGDPTNPGGPPDDDGPPITIGPIQP
ncbi:Penicillin-binding protein 2D [Actinokineospora sp. UTMC 2448]|nr:Penicillin-binding protein 2D [Actinokineospora sp. UTMC 2448]